LTAAHGYIRVCVGHDDCVCVAVLMMMKWKVFLVVSRVIMSSTEMGPSAQQSQYFMMATSCAQIVDLGSEVVRKNNIM